MLSAVEKESGCLSQWQRAQAYGREPSPRTEVSQSKQVALFALLKYFTPIRMGSEGAKGAERAAMSRMAASAG